MRHTWSSDNWLETQVLEVTNVIRLLDTWGQTSKHACVRVHIHIVIHEHMLKEIQSQKWNRQGTKYE